MGVILYPQGGYRGSEAHISLTALVLIALNEGKDLCRGIQVRSKEEGDSASPLDSLPPGSRPILMSLSVHSSLLTLRHLSSNSLPLVPSL